MSAGGLLLAILVVFGGLAYLQLWTKAFADLLWMLALRHWLVGLTAVTTFLAILGLAHALCGLPTGSPSLVLLGLLAAPPMARHLADWLAMQLVHRQGQDEGAAKRGPGEAIPDSEAPNSGASREDDLASGGFRSEGSRRARASARQAERRAWRNFIFAETRRRQDANYEAPPIGFD